MYGGVPFVAEIKGSKQQTARSGVSLEIARPQPPPDETVGSGTGAGVWLAFLPFVFGVVLPSVPTLALLCRSEDLQMGCCHITNQTMWLLPLNVVEHTNLDSYRVHRRKPRSASSNQRATR